MKPRASTSPPLTIEWSKSHVRIYDPLTSQYTSAERVQDIFGKSRVDREAIVAISRQNSFTKVTEVPNAPEDEVAQILSLRLGDLFPSNPEQLAYDFLLGNGTESGGRYAILGAVQTDVLRQLMTDMSASGIHVLDVLPVSFASIAVAKSVNKSNCAVVESSDQYLSIDIVIDGDLRYSRVVHIADAELDVTTEINRTFQMAKTPPVPVVTVGGWDLARAEATLPHPALETLNANQVEKLHFTIELPEAVAQRHANEIKKRAKKAIITAAVAALVVIGVYTDRVIASTEVAKVEEGLRASFNIESQKLAEAENKLATAKQISENLEFAMDPGQRFCDIATVISNKVPQDVWLNGLTIERGKPVTIRGTAKASKDVATYLEALSNEPRFRDTKLLFANKSNIESTPVINFSITTHAIGNLPIAIDSKERQVGR